MGTVIYGRNYLYGAHVFNLLFCLSGLTKGIDMQKFTSNECINCGGDLSIITLNTVTLVCGCTTVSAESFTKAYPLWVSETQKRLQARLANSKTLRDAMKGNEQ